ncbi:MAG: DNA helicase RecQ [Oscillospiraceae bacterium]
MPTSLEILKETFGYDKFLEGQEPLINSILSGRDTLGVMPTGAGKSLCFQVPALMMPGITLIISPLISLMKDQVNALTQAGVRAAFINSSLTERQISLALQGAESGIYKLIYIAPERLMSSDFLYFAQHANISMLTVDEAHCISQWGQDFRKSYARIPEFLACLAKRPVVSAFTATATQKVREDIVRLLELVNPTVLITGFDRPNLYFEVKKPANKLAALLEFLQDKKDKSGIVYCSTRAAVEEVCAKLCANGYSASRYHAGLSDKERHLNQDDFLYDRVQIMAATNAFGMGIDKSNVSFVVHYNMPKDIESYYQEAGRAGRDGQAAECILLYSGQDVRTNMWLIENARDKEYPDGETEEILKERDRKRLREMTFFCATGDCLRAYILKYFGETPESFCGNCGNCNQNFETADIRAEAELVLSCVNSVHGRFGKGMISEILRGCKTQRLLSFNLNKLACYGKCKMGDKQMREIIDFLLLEAYLVKTDAEYPVIQIGTRQLDSGGEPLLMKLQKQSEETATARKSKKTSASHGVNEGAFAQLRELRLEIAKEQHVPAYAVFPDSTLVDMCAKLPQNEAELLQVLGVGQVKLARYGERFLREIAKLTQGQPKNANGDSAQSPTIAGSSDAPNALPGKASTQAVTITAVADIINCTAVQNGGEKATARKLNTWLIENEYLEMQDIDGKAFKVATQKGIDAGIYTEKRIIRGENCYVNMYKQAAQEMLMKNSCEE